jgi:lysophospholipase L1-like esterase
MKTIRLLTFATLFCAANLFGQTNSPDISNGKSALIPATRSTPTNWMSRHDKFVEQAKQGGVNLLFMGDSITDFWRSRGSNVWNKYYAPQHAANFGIGGDRTQHVLWRIEHGELDGIKPKVCVLMIGTNNSKDDSPDDISAAIKKIIDDFHAKTPATKILLLGIFPRGPRTNSIAQAEEAAQRMKTIHAVNEIISKYDDGGKTVKYLYFGDKFLDADGKIPMDIMPDQLHPSPKGYQIWADAMNPTLDAMMVK